MSIISAVTRKRKKCLSVHLPGSSAEEDSEHEPVKTSNCRGGGGGGEVNQQQREEEERGGDEGQAADEEHKTPRKERKGGKEAGPSEEGKTDVRNGAAAPPRVRTGTLAGTLPVRTRRDGPVWIRPAQRPPAQRPDWSQPVPLRHRKPRGGRTRAVSMTLELEVGRSEAELAPEGGGTPSGRRGRAAAAAATPRRVAGSLPRLAHGAPPPSSSSSSSSSPTRPPSAWMGAGIQGPSSSSSSAVVLRRSTTLDPRDKTKAWRRHTIIV